ncbi:MULTISPECIES: PAS domain S-box protein [Salinibaculum]|uniref:hybrid sensor histidine kinase/response regulator n=1 Tax=Salinibaculum TaxID=2732368 RepID=UPI0030CCB531
MSENIQPQASVPQQDSEVTSGDLIRVLHVDDDPGFVELTAEFLAREDGRFTVETATSARDGLATLETAEFDCIVSDYDMPGKDGLGFLDAVRGDYPSLPFILFTGKGSETVASEAISAGVTDYVEKQPGTDQYTILANRIQNAITRRTAQERYERSTRRFEAVFEDPQMLVGVLNPDGTLLNVNQASMRFIDVPKEEVIGELAWETPWWTEDMREDVRRWVSRAASGEYVEYSANLTHADGRPYSVDGVIRPVEDASGDIVSLIISAHDITERKKRASEVERERHRYETLFEMLPVPVMHGEAVDGEAVVRNVNPEFQQVFGDTADAAGEYLSELIAPEEVEAEVEHLNQNVLTDGEVQTEVQRDTADGTRSFQLNVRVSETTGDLPQWYAVYTDVTDRKRREERLQIIEHVVEASPTAIAIANLDSDLTSVNPAFLDMWAYDREEEVVGKSVTEFWEDQTEAARVAATVERDGMWSGELQGVRRDGTTFDAHCIASLVTDETGTPIALMSLFADITERKKYEQRLKRQRDNLEFLNEVVRHDIRNDLQVVTANAELLADGIESDDQLAQVRRMRESADHAVELTKTAREITEAMLSTETNLRPVQLRDVFEAECEIVRSAYPNAVVAVDGDIPDVTVKAGENLDSVFRNLLKNGIQHNDSEQPEVTVSTRESEGSVQIRIADNGPGVPDAQKDEIFGKGEKGLESSGTGIGLYLVNTLVERYGGDVWVEDDEPRGAVFVVELPLTAGE